MKTALVILPACLLALVHLTSAISLSTEAAPNCEHVKNLSPQCKRHFNRDFPAETKLMLSVVEIALDLCYQHMNIVHLISKLQLTMCRD